MRLSSPFLPGFCLFFFYPQFSTFDFKARTMTAIKTNWTPEADNALKAVVAANIDSRGKISWKNVATGCPKGELAGKSLSALRHRWYKLQQSSSGAPRLPKLFPIVAGVR